MGDLISKLTSYNLFNYLVPGTVFVVLAEEFTRYEFRQDDLFVAFFAYYFVGMVTSRIGSIIVEPALKQLGFIKFAPYDQYVRRSRQDPRLETLSEANNTYRSFVGVFVTLALVKVAELTLEPLDAAPWVSRLLLGGSLFIVFLFSYRKQTTYIRERVSVE